MKVRCTACDTEDIPETEDMGLDATIRDHLRIWHPDEFATIEPLGNGAFSITPTGEGRTTGGAE